MINSPRTVKGTDPELWQELRIQAIREQRLIGDCLNEAIRKWLEGRGTMTTTTIRDAYQEFVDLHGSEEPVRTMEELRDYIHERGLRYEQLDEVFWAELFESDWLLAETV